jgi:hypothetical protein
MRGAESRIEVTSASDTSRSGSNPDRRSKQAAGTVTRLFKAAIKVVTQRDDDAPQPQTRRRRGTQDGGGPILIRLFPRLAGKPVARRRYAELQPARVSAIPADVLHAENGWDVFDITGLAYEHGIENESGAAFDTRSDYLSPGL